MKRTKTYLCILFLLSTALHAGAQQFRQTKHYAERVKKFDQMADLDSTKIVMLGNSLTENASFSGDWNTLLGADNVCNRGISGDDAAGITNRLGQILPHKPRAIFLMCGTNDLSHDLTAKQVFSLVSDLVLKIRHGAPDSKLYVQSLLPFNETFHRWKRLEGRTDDVPAINDMLRQFCEANGITFINLFPKFTLGDSNVLVPTMTVDGLHLSKLGYQVWAAQLLPYISEANQ